MKKLFMLFVAGCLTMASVKAQAPNAIPYQGVARNASGNVLASQNIRLRISVRDINATGTVVYQETHNPTTSSLGLFNVNIGTGAVVSGSLSSINWGSSAKFVQVEMDATGGTTYANMGTTQLMSVPYALYAASGNVPSGSAAGNTLYWNGTSWVASSNVYNNGANVGIGTTSPAQKLDVEGAVNAKDGLYVKTKKVVTNDGFGRVEFFDNDGTEHMEFNSHNTNISNRKVYVGQELGVGLDAATQTIDAKLHVNGNVKIADGTQGAGKVLTSDSLGVASWQTPATTSTYWSANGNDIRNNNSGNTGIGTTTPVAKLDVNGSGWFREDGGSLAYSAGTGVRVFYALGAGRIYAYDYANSTSKDLALQDVGGNLGVGTSSPTAKLHIAGDLKLVDGTQGADKVLTSDANGLASWKTLSTGWGLKGNAGTNADSNFIGTTDATSLIFKVNNQKAGKIDLGGSWQYEGATSLGYLADNGIYHGNNTVIGSLALSNPQGTGLENTVVGTNAMQGNTTGTANVAMGSGSMSNNTTGTWNVAIGTSTLVNNRTGNGNTALGIFAGYGSGDFTSAQENTFIGISTGTGYGSYNVCLGGRSSADSANLSTFLGYAAGSSGSNVFNATAIGYNTKVNASNKVQIGNDDVNTVQLGTGSNVTLQTGSIKLTGGSPAAGKVLTSDANGLASWQTVAPVKKSISIPITSMNATYFSGGVSFGNANGVPCIDFADGQTSDMSYVIPFPATTAPANATVKVYYTSTTNTGNFDCSNFGKCLLVGNAVAFGPGGGGLVVPAPSTAMDMMVGTTDLGNAGPDCNTIHFVLRRRGAGANDTSNGVMKVLGIVIEWTE